MLTETEFYDRLAEFFDVMTDWQSRLAIELPFLESLFKTHGVQSILDCACGTGGHAIALTQHGYRVAGADISATMIERARVNAQRAGVSIPFHVSAFQNLRATFPEKFDAVLCLGNSFVHVLDDADALVSLENMRACLHDNGVLIMHNLNYDKRWKEKPRWFAVNSGILNGHETLVWRFADYHESRDTQNASRITFNIAMFTKNEQGAWSVQVESTPQRPYQKVEIENLLRRTGFGKIDFYGNLAGELFEAARSGDLVVVATA
jgi:SAM-dependent methyltransferase